MGMGGKIDSGAFSGELGVYGRVLELDFWGISRLRIA